MKRCSPMTAVESSLVLILLGAACERDVHHEADAATAIEPHTVFARGQAGYSVFRIPALVRTDGGVLLAFAEGRVDSESDIGNIDVVMRRSDDEGQTWSEVSVVSDDGPDTVGNPVPIVDRADGSIVLLTTRNLAGDGKVAIRSGTSEGTRTVWLQRSEDDGESWTSPIEVTDQVKDERWRWYATGPGHGIQLSTGPWDGRLVAGANYSTDAGPEALGAMVIYSDDGGRNWAPGAFGEGGPDMQPNETAVVELDDGSIYVNSRDQDGTAPSRVHAWSRDGGQSFSEELSGVADLRVPVVQASLWAQTIAPDDERLLLSAPCMPDDRARMCIHTSADDGASWVEGLVYDPDLGGYSDMAQLPDGAVAVLYEAGDVEHYERIELVVLGPDRF